MAEEEDAEVGVEEEEAVAVMAFHLTPSHRTKRVDVGEVDAVEVDTTKITVTHLLKIEEEEGAEVEVVMKKISLTTTLLHRGAEAEVDIKRIRLTTTLPHRGGEEGARDRQENSLRRAVAKRWTRIGRPKNY